MKKITILSLMLFSAVQGAELIDKDESKGLSAQIRIEVNRVLQKFKDNMDAYYQRTRNPKRILIMPSPTLEKPNQKPEINTEGALEKDIGKANKRLIAKKGQQKPKARKVPLKLLAVDQPPVAPEKTPFQETVSDFAIYTWLPTPQRKHKIIMNFNRLLRSGELQDSEKKQAIKIAEGVNAINLKVKLDAYYHNGKRDFFSTLPLDIQHIIIEKVFEGNSVADIKTLLMTSKWFHLNFLSLPIKLSLERVNKKVNDEALAKIVQLFPQTRELNLNGCYTVTALEYVKELTNLIYLNIEGQYFIEKRDLKHLVNLTKLTHLTLGNYYLTDKDLSPLFQKLTGLTHLYLYANLTDDGLKCLGGLKKLTNLKLEIPYFYCYAGLRNIITGAGLENLKGLEKLADLDLDVMIKDTGLESLKFLPSLTHLTLHPGSVHHILPDESITSATLKNLEGLTKLTHLDLTLLLNYGINEADIEALQTAWPNLEIVRK